MILVFNAMAWGFEHVPFDAALLASVSEAYPGEPIVFRGEAEHLRQVQRYLEGRATLPTVEWQPLAIPARSDSARQRMARDFAICREVVADARRLGATHVIACYLHIITGVLAIKAVSLRSREPKIGFIYHGSLRGVLASRRYHPLIWGLKSRVRQFVLGDSIRDEVEKLLPRVRGHLASIRHPSFFEAQPASQLPRGAPMTFSFLGMIDEMKGTDDFVRLADAIGPRWPDAAKFDLIGGVRTGPLPPLGSWVTTYTNSGPLPRADFDRLLPQVTYAVFPFDQEYYQLIASGSTLDAFAAGKPIIALRNSQFDEMFEVMGDIGYLCRDVDEMREVITSILENPPRERYLQQSRNILANRVVYQPAAVAQQLRAAFA